MIDPLRMASSARMRHGQLRRTSSHRHRTEWSGRLGAAGRCAQCVFPQHAPCAGASGTTYLLYLGVRRLVLPGPSRASFGRGGHGGQTLAELAGHRLRLAPRTISPQVALFVRYRSTSASASCAVPCCPRM